jgi:hypothetical protein
VTLDEFHFGSSARPPGAHQVIDSAFPNLANLPRDDGKFEVELLDEQPESLEQINCDPPPEPIHAAAAKIYASMSPMEQQ